METSGTAPGPRSGCCMATLQDGRILVYGGFCKEKAKKGKKEDEGKTMADMYLLVPDSELIKEILESFLFCMYHGTLPL